MIEAQVYSTNRHVYRGAAARSDALSICLALPQGATEEALAEVMVPQPEEPQPLAAEEQSEKEDLLSKGFTNWNKRDFNAFVRSCEKYGREALKLIAQDIDGKSEEEVGG